jgi:hypothetical protein
VIGARETISLPFIRHLRASNISGSKENGTMKKNAVFAIIMGILLGTAGCNAFDDLNFDLFGPDEDIQVAITDTDPAEDAVMTADDTITFTVKYAIPDFSADDNWDVCIEIEQTDDYSRELDCTSITKGGDTIILDVDGSYFVGGTAFIYPYEFKAYVDDNNGEDDGWSVRWNQSKSVFFK